MSDGVAPIGELRASAAPSNMIYLNFGIGGALVTGGDYYSVARGVAGAFGHLALIPDVAPCECGQHGCPDTVADSQARLESDGLVALAQESGVAATLAK